jgi:hypothetical protein
MLKMLQIDDGVTIGVGDKEGHCAFETSAKYTRIWWQYP